MTSFFRALAVAALIGTWLLSGCATTSVETTGTPLAEPLCGPGDPPLSVFVYWIPQWRPDQKEPLVREALAARGIEDFLSQSPCLAVAGLKRLPSEGGIPSDDELLGLARQAAPQSNRAVLVVVRELGPTLLIGLPVILRGGTEVVIDVRVLDTATSKSLADARTLWRNGGAFVVKGVWSLDEDMGAALEATLMEGVPMPVARHER